MRHISARPQNEEKQLHVHLIQMTIVLNSLQNKYFWMHTSVPIVAIDFPCLLWTPTSRCWIQKTTYRGTYAGEWLFEG